MKSYVLFTLFLGLSIFLIQHAESSVKRYSDDLSKFRREALDLGARLITLEKQINQKKNLYQSSLESIKQFEMDISLYRNELENKREKIKLTQTENLKIIQSFVMDASEDETEEWQRKVHLELLKKAQLKLKSQDNEIAQLDAKIREFDEKLTALKRDENELSSVIEDLEIRKKSTMDSYMSKLDQKKKVETAFHQKNLKQKLNTVRAQLSAKPIVQNKADRIFLRPINDYTSFNSSPKGVTFKYQAVQPVKASGNGKVVFAGDLSTYGQVILIDHGHDIRSVLLGRMNIKVKKDELVSEGTLLAYTQSDLKNPQNLYFEIRKKNTAQNTILWLDLPTLSKI